MEGKNGELERLKHSLESKAGGSLDPQKSEPSPEANSQSVPESPALTGKKGETWSQSELDKMRSVATNSHAFDEELINKPVKEQLAIFNNPRSSDTDKAAAKVEIDKLYSLRDNQASIKAVLYGNDQTKGPDAKPTELKRKSSAKPKAEASEKPLAESTAIDPSKLKLSGTATGRFGGLADPHPEGIKSSWTHYEDPKSEVKTASQVTTKKESSDLNKPVGKVKEGDVSSVTSKKVVSGIVRDNVLSKQQKNFAEIKGQVIKLDSEGQLQFEDKADEAVSISPEVKKPTPEASTKNKEKAERYEKARAEWKEARDKATTAEKNFQEKYREHLKKSNEGLSYYRNLPRRFWGLQPKLTPEFQRAYEDSRTARAEHRRLGIELKDAKLVHEGKTFAEAEKILARYERMSAHHHTVGVYQKRLEIQKSSFLGADKSHFPGRISGKVIETVQKHKWLTAGAVTLGAGVMVLNAPVLAGRALIGAGVGILTRGGVRGALDRTYVANARKNLEQGRASLGENYFEKSFNDTDKEMERMFYTLNAREARSKTIAAAAGIAAGGTAAYYAGGYAGKMIGGGALEGNMVLSDVPNSQLDGIPPDLKVVQLPNEAPIPESRPEVPANPFDSDSVFPDIPEPKLDGVPPDLKVVQLPNEAPIPASRVGAVLNSHEVVKGDNVWNILEGKGPDANPIGGKSEVLKGMSMADRQSALDKLVEYYEAHPEEAKLAGVEKSGGNIHKIYPGEKLNISAFDDKLRELLGIDNPAAEASPTVEVPAAPDEAPVAEVPADPEAIPAAPETPVTYEADLNKMTIGEVIDMANQVAQNDPAGAAKLEALGMDIDTLRDALGSVFEPGTVIDNPDMTVQDYLNSTREAPVPGPEKFAENDNLPPVTPYDRTIPQGDESLVREANAAVPERAASSLNNFVRSIEQPRNGIIDSLFGLGQPNVGGTFEQMKDLTVGEIREMVQADSLPEGVSEAGFDRWVAEMNRVAVKDNNETFADVITRAANSRVA